MTLNNGANVFAGNGGLLTNLNVTSLAGTLGAAQLPADVALLDAANQTFTASNSFTGANHSFIVNTGPISTNFFTGLSLQSILPRRSRLAVFLQRWLFLMSFWTKQGNGFPY